VTTTIRRPRNHAATAPDWRSRAACRKEDPELFFPTGRGKRPGRDAKQICAACPVHQACLNWALETGQEKGVWGGLSEQERRKMVRARTGLKSGSISEMVAAQRMAEAWGGMLRQWCAEDVPVREMARRMTTGSRRAGDQEVPHLRVVRMALTLLGVDVPEARVSVPPPRPAVAREKVRAHWELVLQRRRAGVGMRRIAMELGVHVDAVRKELQAWQQEQQEVAA
jgi:WhiB family redox-sensing transcriptional regulator